MILIPQSIFLKILQYFIINDCIAVCCFSDCRLQPLVDYETSLVAPNKHFKEIRKNRIHKNTPIFCKGIISWTICLAVLQSICLLGRGEEWEFILRVTIKKDFFFWRPLVGMGKNWVFVCRFGSQLCRVTSFVTGG